MLISISLCKTGFIICRFTLRHRIYQYEVRTYFTTILGYAIQILEKIETEPYVLTWNISTVHTIKFMKRKMQNFKYDQT